MMAPERRPSRRLRIQSEASLTPAARLAKYLASKRAATLLRKVFGNRLSQFSATAEQTPTD